MIVGLLIGKKNSMGCPGKNVKKIFGRPMAEYPLMAASECSRIDKLFVSTDSEEIASLGAKYGAEHIERPESLATPESLTEDVLVHAYEYMKTAVNGRIDMIVLLFANSPTIKKGQFDKAISILEEDTSLDSVFSVCRYDMWAPLRARSIDSEGLIKPAVDLDKVGDTEKMSSIRGAEGGTYFCDLAVQVVRAGCFENIWEGPLPFRWMGHRSYALESDYGFDIDYNWQIPVIEFWLSQNGFTDDSTPYDK